MPVDYMDNLNDEQKLAVTTVDGPVLVLSGAWVTVLWPPKKSRM